MSIRSIYGFVVALIFFSWGFNMSIDKGPLGFSGQDYWNAKNISLGDISGPWLWDEISKIVIDVPSKVDLGEHSSIPLICLRTGSKEKFRLFSLKLTSQLVLVHLESGTIIIDKLTKSPDRLNTHKTSPGFISDRAQVNLLEKIDPSLAIGKFVAKIICGPEASNQRFFEIIPEKRNEGMTGSLSALETFRQVGAPPTNYHYFDSLEIQQLPLDTDVKRVSKWIISKAATGSSSKFQVRLSFKVQGLPKFVFPQKKVILDSKKRKIYGYIPISFIGFDEDRQLVVQQSLDMPIFIKPEGESDSPWLSGHVIMDVSAMLPAAGKMSALSLWVFSMDQSGMLEFEILK